MCHARQGGLVVKPSFRFRVYLIQVAGSGSKSVVLKLARSLHRTTSALPSKQSTPKANQLLLGLHPILIPSHYVSFVEGFGSLSLNPSVSGASGIETLDHVKLSDGRWYPLVHCLLIHHDATFDEV